MISTKLKKRFCKDMGLNIQVYDEPFFMERINLFGYTDKYDEFMDLFTNEFAGDEQKYFEYYNALKDKMINFIKASEAYQLLQKEDMSSLIVKNNISSTDVYKTTNIGHHFLSLDMKKANFSALEYYAKTNHCVFMKEFENTMNIDEKWMLFVKSFTPYYEYFAKSKYIRQVVFGNCNCKRLITYEKYIMNQILNTLFEDDKFNDYQKDLVTFCNDELVFNIDNWNADLSNEHFVEFLSRLRQINKEYVEIRPTLFRLKKFDGTGAYDVQERDIADKSIIRHTVKCANPVEVVFIQRYLNGEESIEDDLVFYSQYGMAKLQEKPIVKLI